MNVTAYREAGTRQPPRCGAAFGEVGRAEGPRPGGANPANLPAALAAFGEVGRAEGRRPGGVVGVPNDLTLASVSPLQAPSPECVAF
jgi:DNA polymerase III alpha subunit (gram-positive type)